jgi:hypothetical protein
MNATLEQYSWAYCNYQEDNWKTLLPITKFCYNNTKSETLRVILFYANFGYYPRFQLDLHAADNPTPNVSDYVSSLNNLHDQLHAETQWVQTEQVEQVNKSQKLDPILQEGDKV